MSGKVLSHFRRKLLLFSFLGWMQVVVLIYHWTDSVQVLPLYMAIRVIASSYIFLTGYGHFSYFWHTGDVSITRFFQVPQS